MSGSGKAILFGNDGTPGATCVKFLVFFLPVLLLACLLSSCNEENRNPDGGEEVFDDGEEPPEDGDDRADLDDEDGGSDGQTDCSIADTDDDICFPPCVPQCEGRQCGRDECGGTCGTCDPSVFNTCLGHQCGYLEPPPCMESNCDVFGICGNCPTGWSCYNTICIPDKGCSEVPIGGLCINGTRVRCEADRVIVTFCPLRNCLVADIDNQAHCATPDCLPNCFGRECGPDGCGGDCGSCGYSAYCLDEFGSCVPNSSEEVPITGYCSGHSRVFSNNCQVFTENCLENGLKCGWDECSSSFRCVPWSAGDFCEDLPEYGQCINDFFYYCDGGVINVADCQSFASQCARTGNRVLQCI